MRLCFTTLAYPELTLAEVLERAVRMGFDGVEIRVAGDGVHLKPEAPLNPSHLQLIRSYSLPIPVLSSYLRLTDFYGGDREAATLLASNLLKLASELQAKFIRVYGGEASQGFERMAEAYRSLASMAEDYGVELLVETHDDLAMLPNIEGLLRISGDVRFLYDPANIIYAGWPHAEAFKLLRGKIMHVHLKDFIISGGSRVFTKPGEGVVPLREIVYDLREAGYGGFISVEWERFWHRDLPSGDIMLPIYRDYLRGLI
ncbi:MAG: sugar phosphate isomerase/epimerase family protein [Nitrososphaerota archaeon]